jgi:hypothetical protein
MDAGHGVVVIVLSAQERLELQAFDVVLEGLQGPLELSSELLIVLVGEELVHGPSIGEPSLEPVGELDVSPEPGESGGQGLPASRVIPHRGVGSLPFERGYLGALALDVKGTPSPK